MTRKFRRGRLEVYGAILTAIREDMNEHGSVKLTRVHIRANVAYDRLGKFVDTLVKSGLISIQETRGDDVIEITEKGLKFLDHVQAAATFLRAFGFSED